MSYRLPLSFDLRDPKWFKSSRTNGQGQCVEAATDGATVLIRDSKDPDGPRLAVSAQQWTALSALVKTGGLDLPANL